MGKKYSWLTFTTTQCKEIESVGIRSGWKRLPQENLPSVLPKEFRDKIDSAVMIAAPTSTGGTYLVYNNRRVGKTIGTLLTMLNNSNAVADRSGLTIQESKGETSQHSQQRPPFFANEVIK